MFVRDLDATKPCRFVLMGIPLVIWWDPAASAWRVFKDVCPHRLVPLSEGRINKSGRLECGYHGWVFGGTGACKAIPQGGKVDTPRACATAFPCAVKQGLLFVKPTALPSALLPSGTPNGALDTRLAEAVAQEEQIIQVPELDEGWVSQDTWRDLPYDWFTLMENVLDSSHVPFTHHASMSNRNVLGPYDVELASPLTREGFTGLWKTGPRAGELGPQSTVFAAPGFMEHRVDTEAFSSLTVVYAVPTGPGKCRVINRNVFRFNNPLPAAILRLVPPWLSHLGTFLLMEDDQIFLHLGETTVMEERARGRALSQAAYMPSRADTYVIALHTWVDRFGGGGPFGPATQRLLSDMGPRQGRTQLLDRYESHTMHCATCQKGLRQVRAAKAAAATTGGACAAFGVLCMAVGLAAAGSPALPAAAAAAVAAPAGAPAAAALAGVAAAVGGALVSTGQAIVGEVDPTGAAQALRGVSWLLGAAAAAAVWAQASSMESMFYKGVYPPPRNLKD